MKKGAVRHLSILCAFAICLIYMSYTVKAQETSIRQVPVSACSGLQLPGAPFALILNHGETVNIPVEGRIYKVATIN